ncbi:MAG: hypothetical protein Q8K65_00700 [Alphaproteobacteria bacterium]|nr:hypothetical protein [Alphaproteobacteria bacterium]
MPTALTIKKIWHSVTRSELALRFPLSVFIFVLAPAFLLFFPYVENALHYVGYAADKNLYRTSRLIPPIELIFLIAFMTICALAAEIYAEKRPQKIRRLHVALLSLGAAALGILSIQSIESYQFGWTHLAMIGAAVNLLACAQIAPTTTENDKACEEYYRAIRRIGTGIFTVGSVTACSVLLITGLNFLNEILSGQSLVSRSLWVSAVVRPLGCLIVMLLLCYVLSKWRNSAPRADGDAAAPQRPIIYSSLSISALIYALGTYYILLFREPALFISGFPTDGFSYHRALAISGMSFALAAFCFFVFVTTYLSRKSDILPARIFHRAVFWILPLPLLLGIYISWPVENLNGQMRETAFLRLSLMIWMLALCLAALARRDRLRFKSVLLSLSLAVFVISSGPLSPRAQAIAQEERRLHKMLQDHNLVDESGMIVKGPDHLRKNHNPAFMIRQSLEFLAERKALHRLSPWIEQAARTKNPDITKIPCTYGESCTRGERDTTIQNFMFVWGLREDRLFGGHMRDPASVLHRISLPALPVIVRMDGYDYLLSHVRARAKEMNQSTLYSPVGDGDWRRIGFTIDNDDTLHMLVEGGEYSDAPLKIAIPIGETLQKMAAAPQPHAETRLPFRKIDMETPEIRLSLEITEILYKQSLSLTEGTAPAETLRPMSLDGRIRFSFKEQGSE